MSCLDDDTVFALASGGARISVAIDAHLDSCDECRALLAQVAFARTPARVGPYVLGELLGAGAMGRVYRARQLGIERDVAIKLLPAGDLAEAQAMGKLAHPNVAVVHEVGATDDGVWLAMELVDGTDLRAWKGRPAAELVPLLAEVAAGLAATHAAGVIHRDLKPDNILVGKDRRPRLADFGLAGSERGGTPAYMAPEVLRGAPATMQSDQFSFGITAYELLTGKRTPGPLGPRWLDAVLRRCVAPDPAARYADTADLARALVRPRRRPTAWIATGLAVAAVVTVITHRADPAPSTLAPVLLGEAQILRAMQRFAPAADLAREALATAERDHDDAAASQAWVLRVAIAGERRDLAAAEDLGTVAAGAIDRAGAPPALVSELDRQRGLIAYDRGDLPGAKKLLTRSKSPEHTLASARTDAMLGLVAKSQGDLPGAERHLRAALALDRELHGDVARDLHDLAGVVRLGGDLDGASQLYRGALALETGAAAGLTHNSLALIEMARSAWPAAQAELDQAALLLADHADLGLVEHNLGLVAFGRGDRATARLHYEKARVIYDRTIGPEAEAAVRLRADLARSADLPAPKPRDVGAYGARQPW